MLCVCILLIMLIMLIVCNFKLIARMYNKIDWNNVIELNR
jgi:hypothetical protein